MNMKKLQYFILIIVLSIFAISIANGHNKGKNTVSINDGNHFLKLHSANNHGVVVIRSRPISYWGLISGDRIIASSNMKISDNEDFFDIICRSKSNLIKLIVIRNDKKINLIIKKNNYVKLIPPSPPEISDEPPPPPSKNRC